MAACEESGRRTEFGFNYLQNCSCPVRSSHRLTSITGQNKAWQNYRIQGHFCRGLAAVAPRLHSQIEEEAYLAQSEGIHDSLGFWIPYCRFRIPDSQKGWFHFFFSVLILSFAFRFRVRIVLYWKRHNKLVFFFNLQITGLNVLHFFQSLWYNNIWLLLFVPEKM